MYHELTTQADDADESVLIGRATAHQQSISHPFLTTVAHPELLLATRGHLWVVIPPVMVHGGCGLTLGPNGGHGEQHRR